MPGIAGFEVVRRIRVDPDVSEIPIVMVTALTSREDRLCAVEAGAYDRSPFLRWYYAAVRHALSYNHYGSAWQAAAAGSPAADKGDS